LSDDAFVGLGNVVASESLVIKAAGVLLRVPMLAAVDEAASAFDSCQADLFGAREASRTIDLRLDLFRLGSASAGRSGEMGRRRRGERAGRRVKGRGEGGCCRNANMRQGRIAGRRG